MKTGELGKAVSFSGDPQFELGSSVAQSSVSTLVMLSGQHPMSAITTLIMHLTGMMAAADEDAAMDYLAHFVSLRGKPVVTDEHVKDVIDERFKIIGRLASAYERQTAEMDGGGSA